jgi:valyl-tRNA synthetase
MARKISKTKNNVIKILKKIDTLIYEFGEKIL